MTVDFALGGMLFEYDEEKNRKNIEKHGISFRSAARVFFDYNRIEYFDEAHSLDEDRYNTIGDTSAGFTEAKRVIGDVSELLFVVYTERVRKTASGKAMDVTRIISARLATGFEKGIYYGKF